MLVDRAPRSHGLNFKVYSLMINSVEPQANIISMVLTLIVAKSKGLPLHIIICSEANVNMSLQTNPVS